MADFFGAIAANEIGTGRAPLVFPEPQPCNGKAFPLSPAGGTPTEVYKKPDTREELDEIIEDLRVKYEPFMQKLAPEAASTRKVTPLTSFNMREATEKDCLDFSRVLRGEGEWKQIEVPYYSGPTGATVHHYRTTFRTEKPAEGKAAFLCFDGVDYIAEVILNGSFVGSQEGFFAPFEFDVSRHVRAGENTLVVTV
ncbi:MAG: hypothetical protein IJW21_02835, partial [Clostridia bacterium]|nr:hypothetical protein [Clostridia bacterium]